MIMLYTYLYCMKLFKKHFNKHLFIGTETDLKINHFYRISGGYLVAMEYNNCIRQTKTMLTPFGLTSFTATISDNFRRLKHTFISI